MARTKRTAERDRIRHLECLFGAVDHHDVATAVHRRERLLSTRRGIDDALHRRFDGIRGRLGPGNQPRETVWTVLSLHDDVNCCPLGWRRRISNDYHLGGSSKCARHADGAAHFALRDADPLVAWTDDDIDLGK